MNVLVSGDFFQRSFSRHKDVSCFMISVEADNLATDTSD